MIRLAYAVEDYRLSGGPDWITSTSYDVEATPGKSVTREQALLMLRSLLADRFGLKVHHETATILGYTLAVDKGGTKLLHSNAAQQGSEWTPGVIKGPTTMAELARTLKGVLGMPVEDATTLSGLYDVTLKWSLIGPGLVPVASVDSGGKPEAGQPEVSIFEAVRLQLGLALKPAKLPVDVIVIDHVERPTEN